MSVVHVHVRIDVTRLGILCYMFDFENLDHGCCANDNRKWCQQFRMGRVIDLENFERGYWVIHHRHDASGYVSNERYTRGCENV